MSATIENHSNKSSDSTPRTIAADEQIDYKTEKEHEKENNKLRKEIEKLKEENSFLYRKLREYGDKNDYP